MNEPIYSPGLEGVIAGETAICTITDGLRYRGYAIEQLADNAEFEEVAYLILYGDLPTTDQLTGFRQRLESARSIPEPIVATLGSLPDKTPMMDVMRTGASMLAHWDPDIGNDSHDANLRKAERLLTQLPIVMASRHRIRAGQQLVAAAPGRSLAYNLLWMLSGTEPTEQSVRAMDISLILYAEHEYNASAFASRVVCSTLSDIHSAVTAAIGALKGPLHGGANERVMDVLSEVGSPDKAEAWVRDALARKVKIMGFGHRVYKTGDPRAKYLKTLCAKLAAETNNQAMEQMADVIQEIVEGEKKLPPNLDWPSARLYYYLGLPVDLYTPLFVVSRVVGWSAHIIEQLDNNRIIRPRSRYTGPEPRQWTPIESRS